MSTLYSVGAVNQLADALEKAGFSSKDVTNLTQLKNLYQLKDVLDGEAQIIYPEKKWREENGVIYFKVVSDGTTGEQWIERLEKQGFQVDTQAKEHLLSKDFKVTTGIKYEIGILRGGLFSNAQLITKNIRLEAANRNWIEPNTESACLIREFFTHKDLGTMRLFRIVIMHEPFKNSDGNLRLLGINVASDGNNPGVCYLALHYGDNNNSWDNQYGFTFVVSQTELKS